MFRRGMYVRKWASCENCDRNMAPPSKVAASCVPWYRPNETTAARSFSANLRIYSEVSETCPYNWGYMAPFNSAYQGPKTLNRVGRRRVLGQTFGGLCY